MKKVELSKLQELDRDSWWFQHLHKNIMHLLSEALRIDGGRILDAGVGTGGFLNLLSELFPAVERFGVDISPIAAAVAARRGSTGVAVGSVCSLPFADESFSICLSSDVLYHRGVDPDHAIAEARRCLIPDGVFLVQMPAYQWLYSAHDREVEGVRRFSRAEIVGMLERGRFRVQYATYWNCLLFPLMVFKRKIAVLWDRDSDLKRLPVAMETAFRFVLGIEHALLKRLARWNLYLPFGGSVIVVARKIR